VGLAKAMEEIAEWFRGERDRRQTNALRHCQYIAERRTWLGPIRFQDRWFLRTTILRGISPTRRHPVTPNRLNMLTVGRQTLLRHS
jgi:hypothetical protein